MEHGALVLDVKIPGDPPTKERARTFVGDDGKSHTTTPKKTRAWEHAATAHFRIAMGNKPTIQNEPVAVEIIAVAARPAKLQDPRTGRIPWKLAPDADNISKIICDSLAPSRTTKKKAWICVLQDDALVVELVVRKFYAAAGEKPHVRIRLWRVLDEPVELSAGNRALLYAAELGWTCDVDGDWLDKQGKIIVWHNRPVGVGDVHAGWFLAAGGPEGPYLTDIEAIFAYQRANQLDLEGNEAAVEAMLAERPDEDEDAD